MDCTTRLGGKEKGSLFSSLNVKVAKEERVVSSDDAVLPVAAGAGGDSVAEAAALQPRTTA